MEDEVCVSNSHIILTSAISSVIGHRGGGGTFGPENLISTMKKAVEVGVQLLEFDIRSTMDGHLVICHDDENWFGTISTMSFSSLSEIDAAYWWTPDGGASYPLKGSGHKIATLQHIFEEFAGNADIYFFLDFKSLNIAERVFSVVQNFLLMDRIIVGAMDDTINKEMMTFKPSHVPASCSLSGTIRLITKWTLPFGNYWFTNEVNQLKHDVIMIPLGYTVGGISFSSFLSSDFVYQCHLNKKKVWVFGPGLDNIELQNYAFQSLKVDGVIADLPDLVLSNLILAK
jgi:glycerophosphoryl diester phosphodiesterase